MAEMSAFALKSLEAKNEKILKELTRVAANRKCVDCDNMGPQYVITSFGVFVCTACGGLHRQYGHRVKGISMSRFSTEEIAALQDGGNEKFMATYCATWTATAIPRPTDRNPERTKAWIEEIYQNQKYFSSSPEIGTNGNGEIANSATPSTQGSGSLHQNGHATPSAVVGSGDSTISTEEDVVHVLELTDLGAGMAKLQIGGPVVSTSSSSSSPLKQSKSPSTAVPKLQMPMPLSAVAAQPAAKAVSSSPKPEIKNSPRPEAVVVEAVKVPEPVAAPVVAAQTPSLMDAWDPFGDVEPVSAPNPSTLEAPAVAVEAAAVPVENGTSSNGAAAPAQAIEDASSGWDAFAEEVETAVPEEKVETTTITPAALHELLAPGPAPAAAVTAVPTASTAAPSPGWAVDFGSQPSVPAPSIPPQQQQQQQQAAPTPSPPPPSIPGRKEISLDTFYPEFETIRATGVLPTGQPVLQAQMTQWGVSPYGQHQQAQHAQHATHQFGVVPPSPVGGGHAYMGALPSPGYVHLSPQQQHQVQQHQQHVQFQQQQQHGLYSTAGTPTGSSYFPPPSPVYGQQQQSPQPIHQYVSPGLMPQQQQQRMQSPSPLPSPATSVASVGRPPSGSSTASSQGKLGIDPFAHLAPVGVGNQGQMQATLPSPTPPLPAPAAAPSAVGSGSQTQAASATLFGIGTSLTAYDLSAPAAPKPRSSGNPFA